MTTKDSPKKPAHHAPPFVAAQFKCPKCPRMFKRQTGLGIHMRAAHGVQGTSKTTLAYHRKQGAAAAATAVLNDKRAPSRPDEPFKCEQCSSTFRTRAGLGSHMRNSHGVPGKFLRSLESVPETVEEVKRAEEEIQPQRFEGAVPPMPPATTHVATKDIPGPPFKCPECKDDSFNSRAFLGRHRRFAHGVAGKNAIQQMKAEGEELQLTGLPKRRGRPPGPRQQSTALTQGDNLDNAKINSSNGHQVHAALDPIAYALTVGAIKEFCRNAAEEHGIPTREFTRHCAQLFFAQTRR